MKKTTLTLTIILLSTCSLAQQWNGSSSNTGLITRNGEISVLNNGNMSRFSIGNAYCCAPLWATSYLGFNLRKDNSNLWSYSTDGANSGGAVIYGDVTGGLNFCIHNGHGIGTAGTLTDNQISTNTKMFLDKSGRLLVGDKTTIPMPIGYKLYVQEGILTEKVKVALANTLDWSDYVFDKAYKLLPLTDVEQFIKANKHLPEVPSASDMVSSGLDVAKTDAMLLKKIEELTLYLIELKKENENLKSRVLTLEK